MRLLVLTICTLSLHTLVLHSRYLLVELSEVKFGRKVGNNVGRQVGGKVIDLKEISKELFTLETNLRAINLVTIKEQRKYVKGQDNAKNRYIRMLLTGVFSSNSLLLLLDTFYMKALQSHFVHF